MKVEEAMLLRERVDLPKGEPERILLAGTSGSKRKVPLSHSRQQVGQRGERPHHGAS